MSPAAAGGETGAAGRPATSAAVGGPPPVAAAAPRGTAAQRARATGLRAALAVVARLPDGVADALADTLGELWYRLSPRRAARARGNLAHVAERVAARGTGPAGVRAAAGDPAALERLVRAAFRHDVRTYVESMRGPAAARRIAARVVADHPDDVEAAFAASGPTVFVTLHLGSIAGVSAYLADRSRTPVTAPMETLADPEMQRLVTAARAGTGLRIVGLAEARRELGRALERGENVGLVADRDVAGSGVDTPLFDLPAPLPMGPAYLALEAGAPLVAAAVRRERDSGYRGRLIAVPDPPVDLPRRARVEALLAAQARAFEELIALSPEQWWAVFHPIWPAVGPRARTARRAAGSAS